MEVPDVVATAVPLVITELAIVAITADEMLGEVRVAEVKVLFVSVSVVALPTSVSVATGRVSVPDPATAGAAIVMLPDVSPATTIELKIVLLLIRLLVMVCCLQQAMLGRLGSRCWRGRKG